MKRFGATAFIAPFVSFQAEMVRIAVHNYGLAFRDMRSSNPEIAKSGVKRMLAHSFVLTAGAKMVGMMAKVALGTLTDLLDEEEESADLTKAFSGGPGADEAIKHFISKYYKDGAVAVLGANPDGRVRWMDISFVLPHSPVTDPLATLMKGEWDKAIAQLAGPYFSPQLWLQAINEGSTVEDYENFEYQDNPYFNKTLQAGKSLTGTLTPALLKDASKIISAFSKGTITQRGRVVSPWDELISVGLGTKIINTDINEKYRQSMRKHNAALNNARGKLRRELRQRSTMTEAQLEEAYQQAMEEEERIYKEAYSSYKAAQGFLGADKAYEHLADTRSFSTNEKETIAYGRMLAWRPSKTDIEEARKLDQEMGDGVRIPWMRKKLNEVAGSVTLLDLDADRPQYLDE
jgi:hypothetical protein